MCKVDETAPNKKHQTKIKSFFGYKAEILCMYAHYLPVSMCKKNMVSCDTS